MPVISLQEKFELFNDHWSPKIIGTLNGQDVKLAKLQGEFVWHNHAEEDELFMVIKGQLIIELRDETLYLSEGELAIIPRGVEHRPVAKEEVWIMLFEPASIHHTGNVRHDITVDQFDRI